MLSTKPYRIGFLLLPDFSYFGLVAAIQPLFLANWRAQQRLFNWSTFSADGRPVRASNATLVPVDAALSGRMDAHTLFVLASFEPKQRATDIKARAALRRVAGTGIELGGIETGSELLAAAGLLDGRTAAVHWDNLEGFRERYPKVHAVSQLFHAEPGRLTCAGGTSVIDMMLQLVAREAGEEIGEEVAQQMLVGRPRQPTQKQVLGLSAAAQQDPLIRAAVGLMRRFVDEPLRTGEVARRLQVSARHLRRRFRSVTGSTTAGYYVMLRLSRAHNLLQQTDLSVTEVAITCGFGSLEHFSRVYRGAFGCAPSRDRRQSITAPVLRQAGKRRRHS